MALEAGAPFKDACRSNQLDETLAYDWIRKADDEGVARCYGEFRDAVRRAIARGNVRLVTNIARAAQREEVQRTSATCPACGHTHEVAVRVTLPNDFRAAVQLLKWRDPESYPSDRFISEMRFAGDPGAMAQIQIYIPAKDGGEPQLTGG